MNAHAVIAAGHTAAGAARTNIIRVASLGRTEAELVYYIISHKHIYVHIIYYTHTQTNAGGPIGSQYNIYYIYIVYVYGRGWEMLLLQCIRAKLGCPQAI